MKKKLIEVALPLDAINAASAREKSIRHGHPSTLHLWWARRPLATARAVLFASLVDDPSSRPEEFPTKEAQDAERQRLFRLIEKMVIWENSGDKKLFAEAYEEIKKSTGGNPPPVFDPFAGGGTIPLEAQRLGLKAIAADLNPVAVMINKAMIEIPARFRDMPPVNPEAKNLVDAEYSGVQGLAADIAYYGKLMKERAFEKIGHLYPKVKVPGTNQEATVIAWIWARTVVSPNPLAHGAHVPLVSSFMLSKKKSNKVWVEIVEDTKAKDGWRFEVKKGTLSKEQEATKSLGTKAGKAKDFLCCLTNAPIKREYIQEQGKAGKLSKRLMAIVALGDNGRIYLNPSLEHEKIALDEKKYDVQWARESFLCGKTPTRAMVTGGVCSAYGLSTWGDLFTDRQLTALITFINLIFDIQNQVITDGGSKEYSEAISVYLSFYLDRYIDFGNSLSRWKAGAECPVQLFSRQAIPMVWDFSEVNPFSDSSGSWNSLIDRSDHVFKSNAFDFSRKNSGKVYQWNAMYDNKLSNMVVSTDPPYYDNISYAELSDFFYIWMRQSLKNIYPNVCSTMLAPKKEELVVTPYRFDGSQQKAKEFFEDGMVKVCRQLHKYARDDIPLTIYYAFKQNDMSDEGGIASSGWETMLSAIISAGFAITGTWPMRTEMSTRQVAMGTNALASSIVLVCRKRPATSAVCTRKNFLRELKSELQMALAELQASNIAPVDMAQSAIGPGISVYSRYEKVLEADGSPMTVRSALKLINQALDEYFHGQGENLDSETRFCIDFYTTYGFNEAAFGEADVLARAKNVAMNSMTASGAVVAAKGKVRLAKPEELPEDDKESGGWIRVQRLVKLLAEGGITACAESLRDFLGDTEGIKNLAYRLYQIADKKGWAQDGTRYNNLVVSWQDILEQREALRRETPEAIVLDFEGEDKNAF